MFFLEILLGLIEREIQYLVVGGVALNLHGVPRITMDLDLILETRTDNIHLFLSLMKEKGYRPRLPVDPAQLADPLTVQDWIENRNMKAFSFFHEKEKFREVDVLLSHPLDWDSAFARRTLVPFRGQTLNVVDIRDLILMKRVAGRSKDLSDIDMLERVLALETEGGVR